MGNWNSPGGCWSSNLLLNGQTWPLGSAKCFSGSAILPKMEGANPLHSVWPKGGEVGHIPCGHPMGLPWGP